MANSTRIVQDRLWRVSHAQWKSVKQVVEWLEVIVVVLASVALILFLLFGVGDPLP